MTGKSDNDKRTYITVEQMVDFALGTPEIGAVNFNVLHALLHIIVRQLNIQKCLIELECRDSEKAEGPITMAKSGAVLKVCDCMGPVASDDHSKHESTICCTKGDGASQERRKREDGCGCGKKKKKRLPKEETEMDETRDRRCRCKCKMQKIVICRKEEDSSPKEKPETECEESGKKKRPCPCKVAPKTDESSPETKIKEISSTYYDSEGENTCTTVARVDTIGGRSGTWRARPASVHESLVKMEEKVTLLQDAFQAIEKMATNEELMKRTSSSDCVRTPIRDMWQLYNLHKRVESCEGAIEKLASMIEDLVKESCSFREALMIIADAVDSIERSGDACENGPPSCREQQPHGNSTALPTQMMKQEVVAYPVDIKVNPCEGAGSDKATTNAQTNTEVGATEETDVVLDEAPDHEPTVDIGPNFFQMNTGEKFCVLKKSIECLASNMKMVTDIENLASKMEAMETMQKNFEEMLKEWGEFLRSFDGDQSVVGTVKYIKDLRKDIDLINEEIGKILEGKHQLELRIKVVEREIELLKAVKADKEVMEDLLAEKADAILVNRKVSHDQFDAACDDLTKGLDEALEKLFAQEALWNEAMDELQKDMDNKLDKMEIMPLKEFISKKLKGLQLKLKQLAQLRKDAEAAGAKSRILRNLNCISCDKDVIMRMDQKAATTQHPALPPSRTIRPYIAYELDQVRKTLKKEPPYRGASHVNKMILEVQKSIGVSPARDGADTKTVTNLEQYCNRYCGGSHTITTPQQRVTRIGHFLTDFGSQAMTQYNKDVLNPTECKPVVRGGTQQQDTVLPRN